MVTDPNWVQPGELGFAFVMLILATGLVRYVLVTSRRREDRLLGIIEKMAPALQLILDRLDSVDGKLNDVEGRLEDVEQAVGVERPHKKRHHGGLVLNDA